MVSQIFPPCRRAFASVGVFSLVVNLLLLTTSIYLMQVFDRVLASGSRPTLFYLTLIAAGALLVLATLDIVRGRVLIAVSAWIETRLAPVIMARTLDEAVTPGAEPGSALSDLGTFRSFVGSPALLTLFDLPWVPIYLAVIYMLDPLLGHVALAGALVLAALAWLNDIATRRPIRESGLAGQRAARVAHAAVRNSEVVDALGLKERIVQRWMQDAAEVLRLQVAAANRTGILFGTSKFVRLLVQIAIIAAGALLVLEQQISGGAIIAASIIMGRALAPVEQSIGMWKQAVQARIAFRRLKAFLLRPERRIEGMSLPAPTGHLCAERIVFGFSLDKPPVLKGVSFGANPGEAIAVIGPSAAGKSTLARLLVGTARPSVGVVRLDGADMFTWPRRELAEHIGYLPQDTELFSGTVADNIARLGAIDEEEVVAAAQLSGCHEMILQLPDGYDTELGEGGARLSAGQRQRVGLARALYRVPKLVVLDEPNANLDSDGELALNRAILEVKRRGATVIVIGHRPSTLAAVDKILVLIDGRVDQFDERDTVLGRLGRKQQTTVANPQTLVRRLHAATPPDTSMRAVAAPEGR